MKTKKLAVVGAGNVGSATAFAAVLKGLFSEIVIIDINTEKAQGEALDIMHGVSFANQTHVFAGDYSDCKGADVIVITAGAAQGKNETRLDLLKRNAGIYKGIIPQIIKYCNDNAIIIPVTNPVDILSYLTYRISGLDKKQVIGSGTVLDTSRFKYTLSCHTGVDMTDITAYILGEHGDSELPLWSKTSIAGISVPDFCRACGKCDGKKMDDMFEEVKNAAYDIIAKKGSTYYAIALATNRIIEAVLRDSDSILTVSTCLQGEYGINDVYLSVPTIVNAFGASKILEIPITSSEQELLKNSAETLKSLYSEL